MSMSGIFEKPFSLYLSGLFYLVKIARRASAISYVKKRDFQEVIESGESNVCMYIISVGDCVCCLLPGNGQLIDQILFILISSELTFDEELNVWELSNNCDQILCSQLTTTLL